MKPIANKEAELQYLANMFVFDDYHLKHPVQSGAFFYDVHRWIHEAAIDAHRECGKMDAVYTAERLMGQGRDRDEVLNVVKQVLPIMGVSLETDYAKLLNTLYVKRRAKQIVDVASAELAAPSSKTGDVLAKVLEGVNALSSGQNELSFRSGKEIGQDAVKSILEESKSKKPPVEMSTGCNALDNATCGYQRGCVWLLGAQSHWGKSAHALMTAAHNASKGKKMLIVSGEDALSLWGRRYASMTSGVTLYDIMHRRVDALGLSDLAACVNKFEDNLYVFDAIGMSGDLAALHVDALVQRLNIDMVFVDYMKVFADPMKGKDERERLNLCYDAFTKVIKKRNIAGVIYSQITPPDPGTKNPSKFYLFRGSKDIANRSEVACIGLKDDEGARVVELTKNKPGPLAAGDTYYFKSNKKLQMFEAEKDLTDLEFGEMSL